VLKNLTHPYSRAERGRSKTARCYRSCCTQWLRPRTLRPQDCPSGCRISRVGTPLMGPACGC
jgi:hypothetical protein